MPEEQNFPPGFLWGAATAGHQVEGDNRDSDWWAWEQRPEFGAESSGRACEHFTRYPEDLGLLADLGLNTYRYSIEWSRVEPRRGEVDRGALEHYRRMTEAVRAVDVTPMVTLNHFTVPQWFATRGGWTADDAADRFAAYCRAVVGALGDLVDWWCTLNEPGNVAVGGYLGVFGWPPGTRGMRSYDRAVDGLLAAHRVAREVVKAAHPDARVGMTHGMQEWEANDAGRAPMLQVRRMFEDAFLDAAGDDDFLGIQTYTRVPVMLPRLARLPARALADVGPLRRALLPTVIRKAFTRLPAADGVRRTEMGYEYRPEAIAATLVRAAELHPGKDLVVTEHGIATNDDAERIDFIRDALTAIAALIADGLPIRGYLYWSLLDNFEWAHGYRTRFGLVEVDRATLERRPRPSASYLGGIARTGRAEP